MRKFWGWVLLVFALSAMTHLYQSDSIPVMAGQWTVVIAAVCGWFKLALMSPKKEGK